MKPAEIVPIVGVVLALLSFWRAFRKDTRDERGRTLEQEIADERLRQEWITDMRESFKERNDELRKDLDRLSKHVEKVDASLEAERDRTRRYLRRIEQLEQALHAGGIAVPPAPPVP